MTDSNDARAATRRKFLVDCGKFAAVTPPAISLLLASSNQNFAVAASGGNPSVSHANNGFGNGPFDGIPGKSAGKGANGKKHGPITDEDR